MNLTNCVGNNLHPKFLNIELAQIILESLKVNFDKIIKMINESDFPIELTHKNNFVLVFWNVKEFEEYIKLLEATV